MSWEKDMSKVMKIAAMRETFPDEWVAAEVMQVDKADVPVAGAVLIHSPDKHGVYRTVKAYLTQHHTARLFIFFTGDPIPEGVEVAFPLLVTPGELRRDSSGLEERGL